MDLLQFLNRRDVIFVMGEINLNSDIVLLQNCPGLHVILYRLKKTSLFGADPCKHHTMVISMFFSENDNNDVKVIIPCNLKNHTASTIQVQIIAIKYFFQNWAALLQSKNNSCQRDWWPMVDVMLRLQDKERGSHNDAHNPSVTCQETYHSDFVFTVQFCLNTFSLITNCCFCNLTAEELIFKKETKT